MTPEREFANFMAQEAEKRGLSYFLVVSNPETAKFSYHTKIYTRPDGVVTPQIQAIVETTAFIKDCYRQAGALEG
jgi:hypothetical protein